MYSPLRIIPSQPLPKVYLFNARVHHGLIGAILLLMGVFMVLDDWADRWWLHD